MPLRKPLPSQEVLQSLLKYNPETGELFWKERPPEMFDSPNRSRSWNTKWAGKPAFTSIDFHGYKQGRILGVRYSGHRVIWKLLTGETPDEVDHENGVRSDNREKNLRNINSGENSRNSCLSTRNTSGTSGVSYINSKDRWYAYIQVQGKRRYLGEFRDIEDAIGARKSAEKKFGYHKNHGRLR